MEAQIVLKKIRQNVVTKHEKSSRAYAYACSPPPFRMSDLSQRLVALPLTKPSPCFFSVMNSLRHPLLPPCQTLAPGQHTLKALKSRRTSSAAVGVDAHLHYRCWSRAYFYRRRAG